MWFGSTGLVSAEDAEYLEQVSPAALDFERLVTAESMVRAFALGAGDVTIEEYVDGGTRFIDVTGAVHAAQGVLGSRAILGVDPEGWELDHLEFNSSGPTVVSVTDFQRVDPSSGSGTQRLIWSKTWLLAPNGWRILSSHASMGTD